MRNSILLTKPDFMRALDNWVNVVYVDRFIMGFSLSYDPDARRHLGHRFCCWSQIP